MSLDQNSPEKKKNFWQRLSEPSDSLQDENERRLASTLATLLLTLLPLYFLPEGIRAIVSQHRAIEIFYFISGIISLGIAYVYARSANPRIGAWITLVYFSLLPFASLFVYPERYQGEKVGDALIWTLPVLVMGLILLRPADFKWVLFFNLGLYILVPLLWKWLSFSQILPTLFLGVAVGGLLFLASTIQHEYHRQARRDAEQSRVNERRYRDIFFDSPVALWEADFSAIKKRLDGLASLGENVDPQAYVNEHPEAMYGAGSSVILINANYAAVELYEAESEDELKRNLDVVVSEQGMLDLRDGVIELWKRSRVSPIETIHKTMKGKERNVIVRFSLRHGYEDSWERVNISIEDRTEQKQIEASVRQLASAVEASASSVLMTDLNGTIEYVNPAFVQKTGYSAEEAIGQNPRILKSGEHPPEFYIDMWDTLLSGKPWRGELVNKKKNGELYWETATISPVKDDTGKVRYYVAVKDDISQIKEAERLILQQSQFLQTVMDGIDSPFYVLNAKDYSIELANKAAKRAGVAEAKTCYALTHRVDAPCSGEHPCPLKHVVTHKEPFVVEHIHYRPDGTRYDVEVHGYPIYDEKGEVVQMIEYSLDISARKEAERQANRLLQEQIAVRKALEAITSSLDIDVVLTQIASEIGDVANATSVFIWRWDSEHKIGTIAAEYFGPDVSLKENDSRDQRTYQVDSDQFVSAIEENHYAVSHVGDGNIPATYEQYLREHGIKSVLYIPLQLQDETVAFAEIRESRRQRDFDPNVIILCQHIAQNAALAINNAYNYEQAQLEIQRRREIEREIRKLSNAAEQAASGIVITNLESVIEFANPAAARITGYEIDELIGQTPNLLKSGMHDQAFYENLWDTIEKGEVWRGEVINRHKDGSLYWEKQVISPVENSEGKVTHYVAVKEDITQAKEAEARIRNLSSAVEQAANAVVITDKDGHIEFVNPAFTVISGYSSEEALGKTTTELLFSGEHQPEFYENLQKMLQKGEIWKGEIINRRKDGTLYWESLVISPIFNDEGVVTHLVEVKEDVTPRKQLEHALALAHEEALVASDMKTQLLANVSHDMRTPLGAILGYTEMLQSGVFGPITEEQDKAMRSISASTQRLLDFVNNLLSQAQIDTGKVVLNKTLFKPEKLITTMGGELSFARSKGLSVETLIDEKLPELVEGDAYWLGQILHNLVSNAIKFTPEEGTIKIKLFRQAQAHWAMSVSDTGKGIPPEAREYIFESFRQVDGSIHRETHTGSGLGLSIVSHLVRLMDGEIKLESELGKGSTFTVILPMREA